MESSAKNVTIYRFQFLRKFTDNFPNITVISQSCADSLFPIFLERPRVYCDQKPYKRSGPSVQKCIDGPHSTIQPIRLQDFAYKHLVRQYFFRKTF